MSLLDRAKNRLRRWTHWTPLRIWYSPNYRLPLSSVETAGLDVRRADRVLGYLIHIAAVTRREVSEPHRIRYHDLARVHSGEHLAALHRPETLATVFAVDPSEIVVDELLHAVRLAAGGTLQGARHALRTGHPNLNLLGGFHHAGRDRASGFCPINDVAIAVGALRAEGFSGAVSIIDLDAHPPDGIAECLGGSPGVWIGSLSAANWGALPGVDETLLPRGTGDAEYLQALGALLSRMPPTALAIVIAGGDVLSGDRCGGLALSLAGARERDRQVAARLRGIPSLWLPGGGYSADAWRVLTGTALSLCLVSSGPVPPDYDPLRAHYAFIARKLSRELLDGDDFTEGDLLADLGRPTERGIRFLGFYTAEGLEHALFRYGILSHLRRLGYSDFRILVDRESRGDRLRVMAQAGGQEHLLMECVLQRRSIQDEEMLYVHWLTLRNPRARFSPQRPKLPGQEVPGLGLAREAGELLGRAAERLELAGIAFRPAWFHTAYAGRRMGMRFSAAERQGRFEALIRDLNSLSLLDITTALSERRVLLNGESYVWEADLMIYRARGPHPGESTDRLPDDSAQVAQAREHARFALKSESEGRR